VDSAVIGLGLRADRRMEVPPGGFPAGWYSRGPTPGEIGPAVLAGHVDWAGRPGVFSRLDELKPQDEVAVTRADRSVAIFRVTRVEQFPKDAFPTQTIYGNLDQPELRLITCGGELDRKANSYEDNIVAFADFVGTRRS
jgi:Sortase domain